LGDFLGAGCPTFIRFSKGCGAKNVKGLTASEKIIWREAEKKLFQQLFLDF